MAKLINKYSSLENKIPVADGMSAGEIAVNFHENKEFLSIKNSASGISTFDRTTTYGKSGATAVNYDSLRLKGSSSATDSLEKGTNSATLGQELQTENAGEVAVGRYNKSTQGQTVFSVGAGTGAGASRSNVLEVTTGKVIADSIETREGIAYATMDIVEDNEYVTAQALNLLNTNINDLSAMTEDFVTKTDYATDVNAGIVRVGGSGLTMSAGKAIANVDGTTIQINSDGKLVAIGGGGGGSVTAGSGISVNAGTVAVKPDTSVGFGFNGSSALTLNSVNVGGDIKTTGGTVSGVTVMGGSIVSTGSVSATGDITTTAGTVKGGTVSGATVKGDNGQFTSLSASSISDGSSNSYVKTNSYASSSTAGVVKPGAGLSAGTDGTLIVTGIPSSATSENIKASGNVTVTGANSQIIASGTNAVISGTSVHGGIISGTTVKGETVSGTSIQGVTVSGTTVKGGTVSGTSIQGTNGTITNLTASTLVDENGNAYLTSEDLPLATSDTAGVVKVSDGSGLEMVAETGSEINDQLQVKVDGTTIHINGSGQLEAIGGGGGGSFTGGTVPGATTFTNTLEVGKTIGRNVSGLTFEPSTGYVSVKFDTENGIQEAMVFSSFTGTNYPTVLIPKYDDGRGNVVPTLYASRSTADPYVYASMLSDGYNYGVRFKRSVSFVPEASASTEEVYNLVVSARTNPIYSEYGFFAGGLVSPQDLTKQDYSFTSITADTYSYYGQSRMKIHDFKSLGQTVYINDFTYDYTSDAQNVKKEFKMATSISGDSSNILSSTSVVAGMITLKQGNAEGTYSATGGPSSSDARLKHNIEDITSENLDKIKNVKLKQYEFNDSDKLRFGAIAQDVESAGITSLVSESSNGYKGLIYQDLLVLKIAYLERELEKLTEKIERLEEKVS